MVGYLAWKFPWGEGFFSKLIHKLTLCSDRLTLVVQDLQQFIDIYIVGTQLGRPTETVDVVVKPFYIVVGMNC
jgi:hypothetical protein